MFSVHGAKMSVDTSREITGAAGAIRLGGRVMEERQSGHVHPEHVVLDIGEGVGALILFTAPDLLGEEIEVSQEGQPRTHTEVLERRINDQPVFAAVYASLPEGRYRIWGYDDKPVTEVEISGGQVAEVDWR